MPSSFLEDFKLSFNVTCGKWAINSDQCCEWWFDYTDYTCVVAYFQQLSVPWVQRRLG